MLDSLSFAFLAVLERLSPEQRAVLLLRDVFGYGYDEIADILDLKAPNVRQLAVRARRHVREERPRFAVSRGQHERLASGFFAAVERGDLQALESVLAEDVVLRGDGGGNAPASARFGGIRLALTFSFIEDDSRHESHYRTARSAWRVDSCIRRRLGASRCRCATGRSSQRRCNGYTVSHRVANRIRRGHELLRRARHRLVRHDHGRLSRADHTERIIPGTLNVGHTLPTVVQAFAFTAIIPVDVLTLFSMIAAAVLGAWLGAGVVAGWSKRKVQLGMGAALLAAATFMLMRQLSLFPAGSEEIGVHGLKLVVAIGGNFMLGALMTLGIGLYAPCMILVSLLGMSERTAFRS